MIHDMELCDQGGEDQDEAWLDGPVARVKERHGFYKPIVVEKGGCICIFIHFRGPNTFIISGEKITVCSYRNMFDDFNLYADFQSV